jgi:hypothetical protein
MDNAKNNIQINNNLHSTHHKKERQKTKTKTKKKEKPINQEENNVPHCLFLSRELRMVFTFYNYWKKSKKKKVCVVEII